MKSTVTEHFLLKMNFCRTTMIINIKAKQEAIKFMYKMQNVYKIA